MFTSSFFGSIAGDRKYKSVDWARYFASFIGNGVFADSLGGFQIIANGGMDVKFNKGIGFINGYRFENENIPVDTVLTLPMAHGSLKRIDRIVARWDRALRDVIPAVISSVPSVEPAAPDLQRDSDIYELGIADITVNAGATSVNQSDITDTRFDPSLCGVVTGLFDQIDASDFNTRLEEWIDSYQQQKDADFMTWFSFLQDTLDTNQAGNLTNLILALTSRVDGLDGRADTIDLMIASLNQAVTDLSNQIPITQTAYDNLVANNLDVTGRVYYILEA